MYTYHLLLNQLGPVDMAFFLICLGIIAVAVAVYFLIPVFRKSQYEERRENLRKREAAFKSGRTANSGTVGVATEIVPDTADEVSPCEPTSKVTEVTEE